jgi:hypothetical protein
MVDKVVAHMVYDQEIGVYHIIPVEKQYKTLSIRNTVQYRYRFNITLSGNMETELDVFLVTTWKME